MCEVMTCIQTYSLIQYHTVNCSALTLASNHSLILFSTTSHHNQSEEVAHTINFIKIDCSSLKSALVGHCVQWQGKLTSLLNNNALADLKALHELFATTTATLKQQPANLDHLSESWTLLEQMKRHDAPAVEEKFAPLEEVC
jgi:dynein heavy chain, axonemal